VDTAGAGVDAGPDDLDFDFELDVAAVDERNEAPPTVAPPPAASSSVAGLPSSSSSPFEAAPALPSPPLARVTTLDLMPAVPDRPLPSSSSPVPAPQRVCGACAHPGVADASFCPHCGAPYAATVQASDVADPFAVVPEAPASPGRVTPTMVLRLDPAEQKRVLGLLLQNAELTVDMITQPPGPAKKDGA
jgi:hypothetical protein